VIWLLDSLRVCVRGSVGGRCVLVDAAAVIREAPLCVMDRPTDRAYVTQPDTAPPSHNYHDTTAILNDDYTLKRTLKVKFTTPDGVVSSLLFGLIHCM
jgi:hypothetical protein